MKQSNRHNHSQAGFTIVELMIATMVFAVILLVITTGVIHFTTDYYKGINSSTTQNTAANIMTDITQAIQFSGVTNPIPQGTISGNQQYICLGNKEIVYTPGELNGPGTGMYLFDTGGVCYSTGAYTGASGWLQHQNLLQPHMRLALLGVTYTASIKVWNVNVVVAYGDDDLLCAPIFSVGSCVPTAPNITNFSVPDLTCRSVTGSQFCYVAKLSTTVQARL